MRGATPPPLAVRVPLDANGPFVGDHAHGDATWVRLALAREDFERIRTAIERSRTRRLDDLYALV